jgi:DNA polymerase-3 subunit delta
MPKPVYALVGDDSFLQLQTLGQILRELGPDVQRADFDGESAQLAEVLDELRSFAMFGSGKLVVVRNADEFISRYREQLEDFLADPPASGTLVLRVASLPGNQRVAKLIAKVGAVERCDPPADVRRWIMDHAKSVHKITVAPDAAALLTDHIGANLGRLDNELAKLALQVESGKVSADDVRGVAFQREQEMWDMTNELAAGRPLEALRRWRRMCQLDNSAEFRAVTWLTMWLEDMRQLLSGNVGKLAWKYKDRLPQAKATAQQLGRAGLSRATDALAEIDKRTKSGFGGAAENVERFILSLSLVQEPRAVSPRPARERR